MKRMPGYGRPGVIPERELYSHHVINIDYL